MVRNDLRTVFFEPIDRNEMGTKHHDPSLSPTTGKTMVAF